MHRSLRTLGQWVPVAMLALLQKWRNGHSIEDLPFDSDGTETRHREGPVHLRQYVKMTDRSPLYDGYRAKVKGISSGKSESHSPDACLEETILVVPGGREDCPGYGEFTHNLRSRMGSQLRSVETTSCIRGY